MAVWQQEGKVTVLNLRCSSSISCSNMCLTFLLILVLRRLFHSVSGAPGREWKGQGWAKTVRVGWRRNGRPPTFSPLLSQFLMLEITLSCLSSYSKKPIKCEVSYRSNTTMQTNFSWTIVGNLTPSHPQHPPSHFGHWSEEDTFLYLCSRSIYCVVF